MYIESQRSKHQNKNKEKKNDTTHKPKKKKNNNNNKHSIETSWVGAVLWGAWETHAAQGQPYLVDVVY
jgi:hypothetical protein